MAAFGIAFGMNSSVSNIVVSGPGVPFPQIFHSFLLHVALLNVASLVFFHFEGDIWFAPEYLTHNLVLEWMLANILDDLLVLVLFSIEMVRLRMDLIGVMLHFV